MPRPATLAQHLADLAAVDPLVGGFMTGGMAAVDSAAIDAPATRMARLQGRHVRRRFRGFTLIEMMIVVSIIALFAGLAAPSVTRLVRDQRTLKQTNMLMNMYREAASKALGRGGAMLVYYKSNGDTTSIATPIAQWQVYESLDGTLDNLGQPNQLPFPECARTKWPPVPPAPGYGTATLIGTYGMSVADGKQSSNVTATVYDTSQTATVVGDALVCFSPKGRVFVRINGGTTWTPLSHLLFTTQRLEPSGLAVGLQRGFTVNGLGISRMVEPCQTTADCSVGVCNTGVCQ